MNILSRIKSFARRFLTLISRQKKLNKIKKGELIGHDRLVSDLKKMGIQPGNVLFVHSSLSRLGHVEGGSETVIASLKEVIGPSGTLILPTFSFAGGGVYGTISDENYIFDLETEPSYVGKISETFRKQLDTVRSVHPTHSVAAWGKDADFIVQQHADLGSNWGKGTPFGKMLDLNVKMIGLGVTLPKFTFFHCVEDYNLNYFPKLYSAEKKMVKVRKDGVETSVEIPFHDPAFLTDRIELNPKIGDYFTEHFLASGKLAQGKVGMANTLLITSSDFYDLTLELAKKNKTIYKV